MSDDENLREPTAEPTEYQQPFLRLKRDEFLNQTNIRQLVRAEALGKGIKLEDALLDHHCKWYRKQLYKTHKWDSCCLKDLKFLPTETTASASNFGRSSQPTSNIASGSSKNGGGGSSVPQAKAKKRTLKVVETKRTKTSAMVKSNIKSSSSVKPTKEIKSGTANEIESPEPSTSKASSSTVPPKTDKTVASTQKPGPKSSKVPTDSTSAAKKQKPGPKSSKIVIDTTKKNLHVEPSTSSASAAADKYMDETVEFELVDQPVDPPQLNQTVDLSESIPRNNEVNDQVNDQEDTLLGCITFSDDKPTRFQADVMQMSLRRFIEETNIYEIARKELKNKKIHRTEEKIQARIADYHKIRDQIHKWWMCNLKHLKYKLCECKRRVGLKQRSVGIQKDTKKPKTIECAVQCDPEPQHEPIASTSTQAIPFNEVRMSQMPEHTETQNTQRNPAADPLGISLVQSNNADTDFHPETGVSALEAISIRNALEDSAPNNNVATAPETYGSVAEALRWQGDGETQGTESNQSTHPIEVLHIASNNSVANFEPETHGFAPTSASTQVPQPTSPIPIPTASTQRPTAPTSASPELNDTTVDLTADEDNADYSVLLQISTQTVELSGDNEPNTDQNERETENAPTTSKVPASSDGVAIVKIEKLSNSRINAKYDGDVIVEEIVQQPIQLEATQNTEEMFENIMGIPSQSAPVEASGFCSTDSNIFESSIVPGTQKSNESSNQSNSESIIHEVQDQTVEHDTSNFHHAEVQQVSVQAPAITSTDMQSEQAGEAVARSQDVERNMANLFGGEETPQIDYNESVNNIENIDPVEKLPRRSVKSKRTQKQHAVSADDTLSTIQPPKYTYGALLMVPKMRIDHTEFDRNSNVVPDDEEPNIEVDHTPPIVENSLEFHITTDGSQFNDGSQIIEEIPSDRTRSTAASILNTGNSIFASTQLQTACCEPPEELMVTTPETLATNADETIRDGRAVSIVPEIEVVLQPMPEPALHLSPPELGPAEMSPPDNQTICIQNNGKRRSTSTDQPQQKRCRLDGDDGAKDKKTIAFAAPADPSAVQAITAAEPQQNVQQNGFEWIPRPPKMDNFVYLHYMDIQSVSYRYEVDRLPSDVQYNICTQQKELYATLKFKCDGLHRIEIRGQDFQNLLKLKCVEWKAVQAVLELVKRFTYNPSEEPNGASLLERTLHYLFASTSKFSNVQIERIDRDEGEDRNLCRVLETTYLLKPGSKRLLSTIDPYVVEDVKYRKRMRFDLN